MNQGELIAAVRRRTGMSVKDVKAVLDAMADEVRENLAVGHEVVLHPRVGKFVISPRSERQGRSPSTGEAITIPAHNAVVFKAAKSLKETVN